MNWDCNDYELEFVFGADKVCRVPSLLAEFLSPKIAYLRRCDVTFEVYTFKDCEMFNLFESLLSSLRSGAAFHVEKSNFSALLRLSQELENGELFSSLLGMINPESLSLEEAIRLLRFGIDLGATFSDRFGSLRDFIAFHFYELAKEILDSLDFETAQIVLSSPSLRIKDEDSLYDFVRSRSENDLRFASLFEFVYFDYLSVDRIRNFTPFANEKLLTTMNSGIWTRICHRLIRKSCKPSERNPRNYSNSEEFKQVQMGTEFFYKKAKKFDGIISYLTYSYKGNVHDKGVVNVTALAFDESNRRRHPKNAVALQSASSYVSQSVPNSWICLDFMNCRVIPKSYTLKSRSSDLSTFDLNSWVIEVSDDGEWWTEIDWRDSAKDPWLSFVRAHFRIRHVPKKGVRYVRLRQTGRNALGDDRLILTALEIFGTLIEQ